MGLIGGLFARVSTGMGCWNERAGGWNERATGMTWWEAERCITEPTKEIRLHKSCQALSTHE